MICYNMTMRESWRSLIRDVPLDILDVGRLELGVMHNFIQMHLRWVFFCYLCVVLQNKKLGVKTPYLISNDISLIVN